MLKIPVLFILMLVYGIAAAKTEGDLAPGFVNPGYEEKPEWFKTSFLDLYEDIDEATEQDKRVMLYFYQDGCPYCKKLLQDNFGQREIAEKTQQYFDVVAINIWGDREVTVGDKVMTEKQFSEALRVQYTPTLIFFNEQRKTVFRANGYYPPQKFTALLDYIGQKKEKQLSYQQYMQQAQPQAASGKLHTQHTSVADPRNLRAALQDGKPLLVMFEQQQCSTCDELHLDILQRETSQQLLGKLNVVVLDMWSEESLVRPDGKRSKTIDWAKELDIKYAPSLVFFDEQGEEVFRSDAYLKAFHTQSVMDYVISGAYKTQPNFQRYIDSRADTLRKQGIEVDLMK